MSRAEYVGLSEEERAALRRKKDNERSARYRERHPDRRAESCKRWADANHDKVLATKRRFNERHKEELAAKAKTQYHQNREQGARRVREYMRKHRNERTAYSRRYRLDHPERIRESTRNYRRRRPDWANWVVRRYQLRKRNAPINDLTLSQWDEIKLAFGHCCAYCGKPTERLTQDHVVPLSKGGAHTSSNIVPACRSCNSRKSNKVGIFHPRKPEATQGQSR